MDTGAKVTQEQFAKFTDVNDRRSTFLTPDIRQIAFMQKSHYKNIFLIFITSVFIGLSLQATANETWVVPIPDWERPPYTYFNQNGEPQGIDIAILNEISNRTGITFNFKVFSFSKRQSDFVNGRIVIDCCISKEWRTTPADMNAQIFTDAIYSGLDIFLFPPGRAFSISSLPVELNDKKVGGMSGYTYIHQNQYGQRIDHDSQGDLLTSVSNGSIDVGILERHVAAHLIKKMNLKVEFGPIQHSVDVGIRLHSSKYQFIPVFNKVIQQMKDEGVVRKLIELEAKRARKEF